MTVEAQYMPSREEVIKLRPQADMLKVSGDGVFATLQGEGITAGEPAVFLRLHYCNLTCGQPSGWKCDTGYTWDTRTSEFWTESEDWSYQETSERVEREWLTQYDNTIARRLVITGGEPLIQQKKLAELLAILSDWEVEIETNGTIMPILALQDCQFNCSPKLSNSGNSLIRRYKPEVLRTINELPSSQFKFVVRESSDLLQVDTIVDECSLNTNKIIVMPEGLTAEEVEIHANLIREDVLARGWEITLRNQLIWYETKRRT